jgi:hypothetical protein
MNLDFGGSASVSGGLGADISGAVGAVADAAGAIGAGLSAASGLVGDIEGGLGAALSGGLNLGASLGGDVDVLAGLFGGGASHARESVSTDLKLEKLTIINTDDESMNLMCLFNPDTLTLEKRATWSKPPRNVNWARQRYPRVLSLFPNTGNEPETLKISTLWFDTYLIRNPNDENNRDVRYYTNKLLALMDAQYPKLPIIPTKRPAICQLHWGKQTTWKCALTTLTIAFNLFDRDGTPVRAKVTNVTFQQVYDDGQPRQNPTSGGEPLRASHVVMPGDTLESIAYREYGDPTRWRILAASNGLENPLDLRPGQRLRIP